MDLERSFGPIYSRGLLQQGQSAFAVLGVNSQEAQASIDAALTFGILWLDVRRQSQAGKFVVEGLKLFLPAGAAHLTRERMAHLNSNVAKWHLYELEEHDDSLKELDVSDCGNVATRLVPFTDESSTRSRFAAPIKQIQALMPEAEIAVLSPAEIAFRCHGLEFARARLAHEPDPPQHHRNRIRSRSSRNRPLRGQSRPLHSAGAQHWRSPAPPGPRDHPLWRLHPERGLESLVVQDVFAVDEQLDPARSSIL